MVNINNISDIYSDYEKLKVLNIAKEDEII